MSDAQFGAEMLDIQRQYFAERASEAKVMARIPNISEADLGTVSGVLFAAGLDRLGKTFQLVAHDLQVQRTDFAQGLSKGLKEDS